MIEVKNLTKKFNDFVAVDNISFSVKDGEVFAFLGPNGAGKTTTIKIFTTLLQPTSGEVLVNGFDPVNDPDDVRTTLTGPGGGVAEGLRLQEYTLTSQWKLYEHLLARLEYRHDLSNERVFFHTGSGFKTSQDTVAMEVIAPF